MIRNQSSVFAVVVSCAVLSVSPARTALSATPWTQLQSRSDQRVAGVIVCHYSETIAVARSAVFGHLAHGDTLGACPASCSVPAPVPKTGASLCWNEVGLPVTCAATGQDGDLQTGVTVDPRFTDNQDATVTDNLTGLIWLKNAACMGLLSWNDALTEAAALAAGTCGLTDGSAAGDWRLPNIKELQSLFDYGQLFPSLPAGHPFVDVQNDTYWSSTTPPLNPNFAWLGLFNYGLSDINTKNNTLWAWPVRGGR